MKSTKKSYYIIEGVDVKFTSVLSLSRFIRKPYQTVINNFKKNLPVFGLTIKEVIIEEKEEDLIVKLSSLIDEAKKMNKKPLSSNDVSKLYKSIGQD